jgi:hypothetical protein
MTAPDHMSETFKNCLHETGHPHMGPPANPGRVWMPPDLQGDFFGDILARRFYRSCVRPLVVACFAPRAGMQFEEQGPHRFRELG